MNLSSILVYTSTNNLEVLQSTLCSLPGIEVHHQCHDSGRLILIQEAVNDKAEMDGLRTIKALPHVLAAEMFYHYVDNEFEQEAEELSQQIYGGGKSS